MTRRYSSGQLNFAVLAALVYARASGRGQVVDSAIVDGAAVLMAPTYGRLARGTWTDERGTNLLDGGRPWYNVYETSDGRWMAVGAIEDQFYENLVRVLGLDPGESERLNPAEWETLPIRMAGIFRQRTQEEWTATFSGVETCVTPVLSLHDAPRHPHSLGRGTFDGHGWPRSGPVLAVTPTGPAASPPERGRDSASISL